MTDQANESMGAALRQDPSQQPGGDPELEFGPRAPTMPQYFLGYAVVFAVIWASNHCRNVGGQFKCTA